MVSYPSYYLLQHCQFADALPLRAAFVPEMQYYLDLVANELSLLLRSE